MGESIELLAIVLGVVFIAGISRRIRTTILTIPMICMLIGLFIGLVFSDQLALSYDHQFVEVLATITLVMLLTTDASRISVQNLYDFRELPMRLLFIGMPLTMVLGTFVANAMFGELNFWEAAVIAVSLAPTDTSPAEGAVENPSVPVRIRQALDIEGGLNDGITMPFLVLAILLAASAESEQVGHGAVLMFAVRQTLVGIVVGLVTGYLGAKYLYWGGKSGWMSLRFQKICWFALVILTFGAANALGGNGYIAAFMFGITSGNVIGKIEKEALREYADAENSFLMLATYMIFGMVLLPNAMGSITFPVAMYALLSLTLVRMIPVAISMLGSKLHFGSVLYIGWFGPRGIATILYILTIVGRGDIAGTSTIYDVAVLTVGLSLILHGISAWPISKWYGKHIAELDEAGQVDSEMIAVPEMPTRAGTVHAGDAVSTLPGG